jgi:glycosyltransferase involved in cell wall biosynthesis
VTPEPFGRVLLEAMAMRKPVVGSRGGAVPEIVVDGETGYTFAPGDSGELAARILDLLEHPDRARAFGEAGYQRLVDEFHVDRNVERTMAVYARVLPAS